MLYIPLAIHYVNKEFSRERALRLMNDCMQPKYIVLSHDRIWRHYAYGMPYGTHD